MTAPRARRRQRRGAATGAASDVNAAPRPTQKRRGSSRGAKRRIAARRAADGLRPAVFTDRDGTLNREVGYLCSVGQLRLLPRSADGVRMLREAGFAVVIVSNQSGVARGLTTFATVGAVHDELRRRLDRRGAALDGIYFCPHYPHAGAPPFRRRCRCRKPAPGMVRRAARELGLDVARSYVVGDTTRDLELAAAIGAPGVLVLTGHGRAARRELDGRVAVAHVAANFRAAAEWIIHHHLRRQTGRGRARHRRRALRR